MRIRMKIHVDADTRKILRERGLGESRAAAEYAASRVIKYCDPYVPMASGVLKNTAYVDVGAVFTEIVYNQPYAHYQYYGEVMAGPAPKQYTGVALTYNGAPMRGANWDKRMMADRGGDLTRDVARYVKGRAI